MKNRVLLAAVGSFGDLHPYLAIAIGLRDRGHRVVLASSGFYRNKVEGEGIPFLEIPPRMETFEHDERARRRAMHPLDGTRFVIEEIFLPSLEQQYRLLLPAAAEADVLFGSTFALGLPLAAAKLGKPFLPSALQPAAMLSAYDPPLVPPLPFLPWLATRFGPHPVATLFAGMQRMNRWLLRGAYALAAREGIASQAVPRLFQEESPHGKLLLFSRHFMAPQPDFPPGSHFCGFPFYDKLDPTQAGLPEPLRQFLDNGAPPVVFTLGTSAVMDPGAFYDEAAAAMNALGQRAVFLVGRDNLTHYQRYQSTLIHVVDYAPHSQLMPRALVNVHQGGIGTTAQAIRAGRPMVVVPFSHDQPDNARRCVDRGVARTIARKQFRAPALRQALAGIAALEPAAARLGQAIRSEDGVAQACEKIAEIQASPRTI